MNTRLRIAMIGCGDITTAHFSALRTEQSRAVVAACCDTNEERLAAAVDACGNPDARRISDYRALLDDPDIDAVDICLPHHLHAQASIAFTEAGKHVLCEKPLALNIVECDAMIASARRQAVTLMHLEPLRMSATVALAAQKISEGLIGSVVGLQAAFAYWQRAELNRDWRANAHQSGGGHLMDGGIHLVDVLRNLGGPITSVHAMTANFRPELGETLEDLATLNIRYAAGHLGQLFSCHATRGRGASPSVTVFGDAGCLSLDACGEGRGLVHYGADGRETVVTPDAMWHGAYERAISHFLDVVLNGAALAATPEEGRENVRLILAAYESARTGCETPVQTH